MRDKRSRRSGGRHRGFYREMISLGIVRLWQAKQAAHDLAPTRNIQRRPDSRYCEPRTGDADGDPNVVERRTHCWNRGWRWTRSDGRNLDDDGAPRFWRGLRAVPLLVGRRESRRGCLSSVRRVPDVEECRRPCQGRDQAGRARIPAGVSGESLQSEIRAVRRRRSDHRFPLLQRRLKGFSPVGKLTGSFSKITLGMARG